MMEFESAHLHHPHVVKREINPSNWYLGVPTLDQVNNFAMAGSDNTFAQGCAGETNPNDAYTRATDDTPHTWGSGLGQSNGFLLGGKGMIEPTINELLGFGNDESLPDDGRDQTAVQNDTTNFGTMNILDDLFSAELNNGIYDQPAEPQIYSNQASNNIEVCVTTVPLDSVISYTSNAESLDLEYTIASHPNTNGLANSLGNFPRDSLYPHTEHDDETSQIGYVGIDNQEYSNSFMSNQAIEQWIDPFMEPQHAVNSSVITQPDHISTMNTVDDLFTAEQWGFSSDPRQSHSCELAVPMDGYNTVANGSTNASASGTWESPRTQTGWESSISPSPNPQHYMIPNQRLDEFDHPPHSSAMLQVFSPRTLLSMMGNFDTNPDPMSKKRKRNRFSAEGKKKTNKVREVGSCVSCRARKIPCAIDGVCQGCIKTAGNHDLARVICLRDKLKDIYLGVKDIHYTLGERLKRLTPLLESLTGLPKDVALTVDNHRLGYRFQLRLQVMTCASSPSCRWKRLTKVKGIYVTSDSIQDQRYVIVPRSLPSINDYDKFGRQILATSNGSHSGSLTQRLDEFLLGFCENSRESRLWKFADATLRMASLSRLVAYGFLNLYDGSYDLLDRTTGVSINENSAASRYVSETVHDQLRLLAAEGLAPVEKHVFGEIDNLNKHFGKDRNGRIVVGICVLRLMLLYRDRVIRDSIRLGLPRGGERHSKRLEKAAFMYKRLTVAYGTLCRESTPLIMTWEQEDELCPTIEDEAMTKLFSKLQPAFEMFCSDKLTPEYDDLLKEFIIEGSKIERRPSKKRKAEKAKAIGCGGAC